MSNRFFPLQVVIAMSVGRPCINVDFLCRLRRKRKSGIGCVANEISAKLLITHIYTVRMSLVGPRTCGEVNMCGSANVGIEYVFALRLYTKHGFASYAVIPFGCKVTTFECHAVYLTM